MADNIAVTEGAGKDVATDDVGGKQYQRIKLDLGTDGAAAPALAGAGAVATGVQRVTLASDDPAVVDLAAIEVLQTTIAGDTTSLDGKVTACNTGAVVLAAGANAIGKLAANSGVDIGDVDVTSVPAPLSTTGAGTEAAAQRVTIANDSTGLLSVDDNGSSLSVDTTGTSGLEVVQATAADLNVTEASAAAILVDTTSIDGKITACNTGAVVLAAGANAIGKLAANSGVDIGDVDVTSCANTAGDVAHDGADSGNPLKVGGKAVSFDGTVPGTAVAEADRTNFVTDLYGRQYVETTHPRYFNARADYAGAQTNATVQASPGAGLKLFITDIMISNGATAGNITLLDGSGGTVLWEIYPAINGGCVANFRTPIVLTANTLLAITSTTVTTHSVAIQGYIAP